MTVNQAMTEARRRYINFARRDKKSINKAWLGLGMPSDYKAVVAKGLMKPTSPENFRCLSWYTLTDSGIVEFKRRFPDADKVPIGSAE